MTVFSQTPRSLAYRDKPAEAATHRRRAARSSAPPWLRRTALAMSIVFIWTAALSVPAQAWTHSLSEKQAGIRVLHADEMAHMFGQQAPHNIVPQAGAGTVDLSTTSLTSGSPIPNTWIVMQGTTTVATSSVTNGWGVSSAIVAPPSGGSILVHAPGIASVGSYTFTYYVPSGVGYVYFGMNTNTLTGSFSVVQPATSLRSGGSLSTEAGSGPGNSKVNTVNGNKTITVPIVGWTQRGGMPVSLSLVHNSQSNQNITLGHKWTHSYDLYGLVDGSGNFTIHWGDDLSYVFTKSGTTYTPPTGLYDTLIKNVDGTYTLTTKSQTTYHFNLSQRCDSITDENSNVLTLGYTGNLVTSITDATSRAITIHYDASNRIDKITDPLSRVWTLAYNASNELVTLTYPIVSGNTYTETYAYNTNHDITDFKDARGKHSTYSYYADDSTAWEQDPIGNRSNWSYAGSVATLTDANGHTTSFSYDTILRLSQVKDNSANTVVPTYDTSNNKTNVKDERGKNWVYTYDTHGNVLTKKDPLLNVWTYTYNAHNKVLTVKDPLLHTTTYGYDTHDNLTSVTDALTHATTYSYNGDGTLASTTDALTHATTYGYDANGELTSTTDPLLHTTNYTVNTLGWRGDTTDALSHTTTNTYDNWARVTNVTTLAGVTTLAYDADSNVTSVTDPNSHVTSTTYDDDERPLVVTKANGDTFTHTYDSVGQKGLPSSTTDGNSHSTTFTYDGLNRKTGASYADGTSESWTYDAASHLASHIDGKSQTISYGYDNASQLTTVTYPVGTGAGTGISYTYDVAGRKTGMTDVSGTTGYTYDNADRLTSLLQPNATTGYGYDNANRRTSMTVSGVTGSWTYTFDNSNRLSTVLNPSSETATYAYDNANRVTSLTNGNSSVTSYGYDTANRATDVWHKTSTGTTLGRYQYTYDSSGNVSTRTDNDGSVTTFGYDNSDQLTSEVRSTTSGGSNPYTISYTYDHNGNRKTKVLGGVTDNYTYDAHDKLLSTSSKTYGYDLNGNCTSVKVGTATPTTLTYDIENRVTGITYPSSTTNSFVYNGNDLRVGKTDSSGTSTYKTDGSSPASPVLSDGAATYTPGLSEHRGIISKFYHSDALGSTRGITGSTQAATDSTLYDGFGMTVSRAGTTPTPFGFVGASQYQTDGDSGLQLLGHRYYDPSIGRFLSSDPAHAGTNWYKYASNNPLRKSDPLGLFDWRRAIGGGLAGIAGGIVGGPIGAAVAVAIFDGLYDYAENGDAGHAIKSGVIAGGITLIGGQICKYAIARLFVPVADAGGAAAGGAEGGAGGAAGGAEGGAVGGADGGLTGGCFIAGTLVQMADGTSKPIQTITRGEKVKSRDEQTGKDSEDKVRHCTVRHVSTVVVLHLSQTRVGNVVEDITTTKEHPVFVPGRGFVAAGKLIIGTAIATLSHPALFVKSVTWEQKEGGYAVYNMTVARHHTYFVGKTDGGVWVHNIDCRELAQQMLEQNGGKGQVVAIRPDIVPEEVEQVLRPAQLRPGYIDPPRLDPAGRPCWIDHYVYENDGMIYDPGHVSYPIPSGQYGSTVFPGQPIWRFPETIR